MKIELLIFGLIAIIASVLFEDRKKFTLKTYIREFMYGIGISALTLYFYL